MNFLIFIVLMSFLTVVPIMIASRLLGANNSSFMACLIAVIASVAAEQLCNVVFDNQIASSLLNLVVTSVFFSVILGTTLARSLAIALVAIALQFGFGFVLVALGVSMAQ